MDFQTGKLNLDVRDTDTYRYLKANPKMQWLDVYKDKVTGAIMTSVVAPVFSDGKMVGAVGYDINLSTIGKIRAGIEQDSNNRLAILDAKGVVVISFMKGGDGKNINPSNSGKVKGVKDIEGALQLKTDFGWVENIYGKKTAFGTFTCNGEGYDMYATTIPNLDGKLFRLTRSLCSCGTNQQDPADRPTFDCDRTFHWHPIRRFHCQPPRQND